MDVSSNHSDNRNNTTRSPLEWDCGADFGYSNINNNAATTNHSQHHHFQRPSRFSSVPNINTFSTLERLAISSYSSALSPTEHRMDSVIDRLNNLSLRESNRSTSLVNVSRSLEDNEEERSIDLELHSDNNGAPQVQRSSVTCRRTHSFEYFPGSTFHHDEPQQHQSESKDDLIDFLLKATSEVTKFRSKLISEEHLRRAKVFNKQIERYLRYVSKPSRSDSERSRKRLLLEKILDIVHVQEDKLEKKKKKRAGRRGYSRSPRRGGNGTHSSCRSSHHYSSSTPSMHHHHLVSSISAITSSPKTFESTGNNSLTYSISSSNSGRGNLMSSPIQQTDSPAGEQEMMMMLTSSSTEPSRESINELGGKSKQRKKVNGPFKSRQSKSASSTTNHDDVMRKSSWYYVKIVSAVSSERRGSSENNDKENNCRQPKFQVSTESTETVIDMKKVLKSRRPKFFQDAEHRRNLIKEVKSGRSHEQPDKDVLMESRRNPSSRPVIVKSKEMYDRTKRLNDRYENDVFGGCFLPSSSVGRRVKRASSLRSASASSRRVMQDLYGNELKRKVLKNAKTDFPHHYEILS